MESPPDNEVHFIPPQRPGIANQIKALRLLLLEGLYMWNPTPSKGSSHLTRQTVCGLVAAFLYVNGVRVVRPIKRRLHAER